MEPAREPEVGTPVERETKGPDAARSGPAGGPRRAGTDTPAATQPAGDQPAPWPSGSGSLAPTTAASALRPSRLVPAALALLVVSGGVGFGGAYLVEDAGDLFSRDQPAAAAAPQVTAAPSPQTELSTEPPTEQPDGPPSALPPAPGGLDLDAAALLDEDAVAVFGDYASRLRDPLVTTPPAAAARTTPTACAPIVDALQVTTPYRLEVLRLVGPPRAAPDRLVITQEATALADEAAARAAAAARVRLDTRCRAFTTAATPGSAAGLTTLVPVSLNAPTVAGAFVSGTSSSAARRKGYELVQQDGRLLCITVVLTADPKGSVSAAQATALAGRVSTRLALAQR